MAFSLLDEAEAQRKEAVDEMLDIAASSLLEQLQRGGEKRPDKRSAPKTIQEATYGGESRE